MNQEDLSFFQKNIEDCSNWDDDLFSFSSDTDDCVTVSTIDSERKYKGIKHYSRRSDRHHGAHRAVDWLALPFSLFIIYLILTLPYIYRSRYGKKTIYYWFASGLIFLIIVFFFDRAIDNWRLHQFRE